MRLMVMMVKAWQKPTPTYYSWEQSRPAILNREDLCFSCKVNEKQNLHSIPGGAGEELSCSGGRKKETQVSQPTMKMELTAGKGKGHSEAFYGGVAFGQMREGSDLLSSHVIARSSARGVWELTVAIGAGPPAHLNVSSLTSHDSEQGLFQDQSLGTAWTKGSMASSSGQLAKDIWEDLALLLSHSS
ncbi:hypothetical protein Q9966_005423 [Columba livia]|nr:hypothetical protein Q9966_005423 [Columba livia]